MSRRRRPWSRPLSRATPNGRSSRRCPIHTLRIGPGPARRCWSNRPDRDRSGPVWGLAKHQFVLLRGVFRVRFARISVTSSDSPLSRVQAVATSQPSDMPSPSVSGSLMSVPYWVCSSVSGSPSPSESRSQQIQCLHRDVLFGSAFEVADAFVGLQNPLIPSSEPKMSVVMMATYAIWCDSWPWLRPRFLRSLAPVIELHVICSTEIVAQRVQSRFIEACPRPKIAQTSGCSSAHLDRPCQVGNRETTVALR